MILRRDDILIVQTSMFNSENGDKIVTRWLQNGDMTSFHAILCE